MPAVQYGRDLVENALDTPAELKIARSQRLVRVEYRGDDGELPRPRTSGTPRAAPHAWPLGPANGRESTCVLRDVLVKSYETLVDSNTKVDVNTGIVAAGRLQSLIDSRDYSRDLLLMKVQLDQVCDAVKSTVPQEMGRDHREARAV